MAALVGVPVEERDVFRGDFDEARPDFGQAPSQQTTQAESSNRLRLVAAVAGLFGTDGLAGIDAHESS